MKKKLVMIQTKDDFYLDFDSDVSLLDNKLEDVDLYNLFKKNKYKVLLELVLNRDHFIYSPSLTFYINIASDYIIKLSKILNSLDVDEVNIVFSEEKIAKILSNKYLVIGSNYITEEFINDLINNFNLEINILLKKYGSINNLFRHYNYRYSEVGRIIFNLVLSKNEDYPFAFMATYQNEGKAIVPLKHALVEYKDNNKALLTLLSTINKVGKKSDFIKDKIEDKSVYQPLRLSSKDAYTFLNEIEIYEEYGIQYRIPDFWKKQNRKVRGSIRVGGVEDILIISMDGLTGLNQAIEAVYPNTMTQRCVVHLCRNLYKICPKNIASAVMKDFKNIYTSVTKVTAEIELESFKIKYKDKPKIVKKVEEFMEYILPLFDYPAEIRKVIYTTNPIESLNSALRKVTNGKGSFPSQESVMKILYLRVRDLEKRRSKSVPRWDTILNQLIILYEKRITKHLDL